MARSMMSIVANCYLRMTGYKKRLSKEAGFRKYLEECRAVNRKPYRIPESVKLKVSLTRENQDGMDVLILNKREDKAQRQILYLHGGGYIEQPVPEHWRFLDTMASRTGACIAVPIYPKAPDHHYLESFERLDRLYRGLLEQGSARNIVFMGDSSGGGLALAFAQWLVEKSLPTPSDLILISPWIDITMTNPGIAVLESKDPSLGTYSCVNMGRAWAGEADPSGRLLSPINGSIKDVGRITIFIGSHELLLPDARKFRDMAAASGIEIDYREYPKMNHAFVLYPIPEARKAQEEIVAIINNAGT